jgi:hypothetical protein
MASVKMLFSSHPTRLLRLCAKPPQTLSMITDVMPTSSFGLRRAFGCLQHGMGYRAAWRPMGHGLTCQPRGCRVDSSEAEKMLNTTTNGTGSYRAGKRDAPGPWGGPGAGGERGYGPNKLFQLSR